MKKGMIVFILLISQMSCKDFLDTKPSDFLSPATYYATEEQLNVGLNGVYDILADLSTYGNLMQGYMGLDADEGWFRRTGGVQVYNVVPSDINITNLWRVFYKGVSRANILLANIQKPEMDETKRANIKGEALFLRAYFYFVLVSNFGDVPMVLEPVTTPDGGNVARTPAKEVYAQIVKDMTEAETLVRPITELGFGGRVNKSAVQGMLARVHLYMAGWPHNDPAGYTEARKWAKKVIDAGIHDLNPSYQQVFINYAQDKYDIQESILEVEFWGNSLPPYQQAGRVGTNFGVLYGTTSVTGVSYGWVYSVAWLYDSYEAGDLRRDWCIAPYTNSGANEIPRPATVRFNRYAGKWYRKYELASSDITSPNTPQNFALLRYSDVLLMFAEADNQVNGPTAEGFEALNKVRRRGLGLPVNTPDPDKDISGLTKEAFQLFIEAERSRELCYEGLHKRDLVRWNKFLARMEEGAAAFRVEMPTSPLVEYFTNAKARDVLWPIPEREMGINKNLQQNPGWE
ncbi:RagB/SusD family nutrient uptake outer membrane protein [Chitinophaga alhagiae]|uniref:RagB/SusD family nutrient uptake outer membrane protein n=1 Tax=Chitinophaga alhagiae TaxID=2203219 RepID=UPI000E5AB52C|nr:RagB/SusD family nutrient uptake outer membrane protein [Chitinophaga alhagiae]